MYTQFYGLREKPFSLSPDPRFLFLADAHREALAHLLYGIEQGEGFIAITGEVGTGKTTLCRTLLRRLEPGTEVAFIFNPQLSGVELLQAICAELGLETAERSRRELGAELNRFLLRRRVEGRRVLLIVDEAQTLEPDGLEQIRLLSNLETDTEKLLQIILIGQPELDGILESPGLRQLRQRIGVRWQLSPLSQSETRAYVRHRLRIAAGSHRDLFSEPALREVYRRSAGIPRVINLLCDRALLAGYAEAKPAISLSLVVQAEAELRGGRSRSRVRAGSGAAASRTWRRWSVPLTGLFGALVGIWMARAFLDPAALVADLPSSHAVQIAHVGPGQVPAPAVSAPPPGEAEARADEGPQRERGRALDELLRAWGQPPPTGDQELSLARAVEILREEGFSVMHLTGARLEDLRAIGRPALLELRSARGRAPQRHVLLRQIEGQEALLVGPPGGLRMGLDALATRFDGAAWIPWRDYRELPEHLGPGSDSNAVRWLQTELAARGLYRGPASGRFDEATRAAVEKLQQGQRLEVGGQIGPVTKLRLYERGAGLLEPRLEGAG